MSLRRMQLVLSVTLPDLDCTFTSSQRSEWMMLNAPTNVQSGVVSHRYRLRAAGRMREGDRGPVVPDERLVELYPGSISALHPYRVSR